MHLWCFGTFGRVQWLSGTILSFCSHFWNKISRWSRQKEQRYARSVRSYNHYSYNEYYWKWKSFLFLFMLRSSELFCFHRIGMVTLVCGHSTWKPGSKTRKMCFSKRQVNLRWQNIVKCEGISCDLVFFSTARNESTVEGGYTENLQKWSVEKVKWAFLFVVVRFARASRS